MTNDNKLLANRRNALLSTGPSTPEGRIVSSYNARRHGFYSAALILAADESLEGFEELRAGVHDELSPDGVLQGRLADRVALLLWRLDRVTRYEAASAGGAVAAACGSLPPDPDAITGAEVDPGLGEPDGGPPWCRLAFARARLTGWGPVREGVRVLAAALGGEDTAPLAAGGEWAVSRELEDALGWARRDRHRRWAAAKVKVGGPLAGAALKRLVEGLAKAAKKDPPAVVAAVRERAVAQVAEYDRVIAEKERVVAELVPRMRAERAAAVAAGLYADDAVVGRVVRAEGHLTRQLGLTLDLLDRLRGGGAGRGGRGAGALLRQLGVGAG